MDMDIQFDATDIDPRGGETKVRGDDGKWAVRRTREMPRHGQREAHCRRGRLEEGRRHAVGPRVAGVRRRRELQTESARRRPRHRRPGAGRHWRALRVLQHARADRRRARDPPVPPRVPQLLFVGRGLVPAVKTLRRGVQEAPRARSQQPVSDARELRRHRVPPRVPT